MRQTNPCFVTGCVIQIQGKFLSFFKQNFVFFKIPDPQFRPLQICQNGDQAPLFFFQRSNDFNALPMFRMGAVTEINPKSVGAGINKPGKLLSGSRRRPYGC